MIHSGAVELGEVELTSGGTARLELVIAGRNPKAISRHMVGVDWLKLGPVD